MLTFKEYCLQEGWSSVARFHRRIAGKAKAKMGTHGTSPTPAIKHEPAPRDRNLADRANIDHGSWNHVSGTTDNYNTGRSHAQSILSKVPSKSNREPSQVLRTGKMNNQPVSKRVKREEAI